MWFSYTFLLCLEAMIIPLFASTFFDGLPYWIHGEKDPEIEPINQSSYKSKIQDLKNSFYEIEKHINATEPTNMVFILGDTDDDKVDFVNKVTDSSTWLPSEFTNYTRFVYDIKTDTTFYNCPSNPLLDRTSPLLDTIHQNYAMKKIANHAKAVKFIFVINFEDLSSKNILDTSFGRQPSRLFALYGANLFKNINKFEDSFAIVVSKFIVDSNELDVKNKVIEFLQRAYNNLDELHDKVFLKALLAKANGTDSNIGIMETVFHNFMLGDMFGDTERGTTYIQNLKNLLHSKIKYIEHDDANDFGYVISLEAQEYITRLGDEINIEILSNVRDITETLKEYYVDLLQGMLIKIDSLDDDTVITNDIDISAAEAFSQKLKTLSELLSEKILVEMTPKELAANITATVAFLNISVSQESISNIVSRGKDYDFLKNLRAVNLPHFTNKYYESAGVFWDEKVRNHLDTLTEHLKKKVYEKKTKINIKVKSIAENSGKEMKAYFARQEATIYDIQKLASDMKSANTKLLETRTAFRKDFNYIQKISDDFYSFNANDTNIISASNILLTTRKYLAYSQFLQNSIGHLESSIDDLSGVIWEGLNIVLKYLTDSRIWYDFLIKLDDKLSELRKYPSEFAECQNAVRNTTFLNELFWQRDITKGARVKPFLEKCYKYSDNDIHNVILDGFKLNNLKKIIDSSLKNNLAYSCTAYENRLTITGHTVRISDIHNHTCDTTKFIEVFASNTVIFDDYFNKTGEQVDMAVVAPIWDVEFMSKINLDGIRGLRGAESGGNFFGIKSNISSLRKGLIISANGFKNTLKKYNGDDKSEYSENGKAGKIFIFEFKNNKILDICNHEVSDRNKSDVFKGNPQILSESPYNQTIDRYKEYVREYLQDWRPKVINDFYNKLENNTSDDQNEYSSAGLLPFCKHDEISTTVSSAENIKSPINAGINWLINCILGQLKFFYSVYFLL